MWTTQKHTRWIAGIAMAGLIAVGTVEYSPPAAAEPSSAVSLPNGVPSLSAAEVRSMSVQELLDWSRTQFDAVVREQSSFGGVGEAEKAFVGLPKTRDVLNATKAGGAAGIGAGLDGVAFIKWIESLKTAFDEDTSNLETAATLTALVPVLGESIGLAVAVKDGDKAGIATGVVSLVTSMLTLIASNPAAGVVIGMIALLVTSFIHAFTMPDPAPVAVANLKAARDKAFANMLPELASDFVRVVSEGFAVSQGRQVVSLGLAEASIDDNAQRAAHAEPAHAGSIAAAAESAKKTLRTHLQASLTQQLGTTVRSVKAAFRESVKAEIAKPETAQVITDKVFPLYEGNGGYAWDARNGKPTPGWAYFAAEAESNQEFYCLYGRYEPYTKRTAADFAAGADLQDCDSVIYIMQYTFVPNVKKLRSTPLSMPSDAVLEQAVDTALANAGPETVKNLTLARIPGA